MAAVDGEVVRQGQKPGLDPMEERAAVGVAKV
jgi:hypothetical protein